MIRLDKLKDHPEMLAAEICDMISDKVDCSDCPFDDRCHMGHNGALDWLNEEENHD